MRGIIFSILIVTFAIFPACAAAQSCPAGKSVTTFRLDVEPPKSSDGIPAHAVNIVEQGDRLVYDPANPPSKPKGDAKVSILVAADSGSDAGHIAVLDIRPANARAEWEVPVRASVIAVVFGPHGLNEHKITTLVKKNPELVLKLSDYVEQTSRVEALVQTLSTYQQAPSGTGNLQAALGQFSKQYGVSLPAVSGTTPPEQQAQQLLHALLPAFSGNPLAQSSVTQQSTGLAASVATFFMGPQFGVAAGGAALLEQLHAALFPRAEFRAAFAEPKAPSGMDLCGGPATEAKAHTRVAYLWAFPVPDAEAPSASLKGPARIPANWNSTVEVSAANASQLRLLPRARDWRLVSPALSAPVPVKVSVGPQFDLLSVDLTKAKLLAGEYHLSAKWDWTPMTLAGSVHVVNFADYTSAKISQASRDHLVSGAGIVKLEISGTNFEFLKSVTLLSAGSKSLVARLPFSFLQSDPSAERKTVIADVEASHLKPGAYLLELAQLNGKTRDVPVTVHPPNPTLANLPVRVNLGEMQQTIELHGTALERIERITSNGASWTLASADSATDSGARGAIIHLNSDAKKGSLINADVFVAGIEEPLEFSGVLQVAGPRPKILNARKSFAAEGGVKLREKEIPANAEVSFAIQGANFDYRSRLHLKCESAEDTRKELELSPGQRSGADELDSAGEGMLFLSLNAGDVGRSGCALIAALSDDSTGNSDAYFLGKIIRLPRIEKFELTDEKLRDDVYAGILTGRDLQEIVRTGWDENAGLPVESIPTPVPDQPGEQTLKIAMQWPPPSPGAPVYVWLSGETEARATNVKYQ